MQHTQRAYSFSICQTRGSSLVAECTTHHMEQQYAKDELIEGKPSQN